MELTGRWRILEMDLWDRDALDLVAPAFIEFQDGSGSFGFIAVRGWMNCREVEIDGRTGVEFTWDGADEGDQVSGRGWALLEDDGSLQRAHLHPPGGRLRLSGCACRDRRSPRTATYVLAL